MDEQILFIEEQKSWATGTDAMSVSSAVAARIPGRGESSVGAGPLPPPQRIFSHGGGGVREIIEEEEEEKGKREGRRNEPSYFKS
jgi:hypothetical protein